MNDAPVAHLLTADHREHASWAGMADVARRMPSGWSLAGGSLVRLHLAERQYDSTRSTRDIDVVLDVRAEPRAIDRIVTALRAAGFEPDGLNPSGQDHRWARGDAQIDVLTPDFLGARILDRKHPGIGRPLATRGAQFALDRTERVRVQVDDFELDVNRPNLVGALYGKCSALLIPLDANKARHLEDIAALADILGPHDRRELLHLRRRQRARVIFGLRRTLDQVDLDARGTHRLARLIELLAST